MTATRNGIFDDVGALPGWTVRRLVPARPENTAPGGMAALGLAVRAEAMTIVPAGGEEVFRQPDQGAGGRVDSQLFW